MRIAAEVFRFLVCQGIQVFDYLVCQGKQESKIGATFTSWTWMFCQGKTKGATRCLMVLCGLLSLNNAAAQSIRVTSTAQEVTVVKQAINVSANPNGVINANCTLGEALLAVNRRRDVDDCKLRDSLGAVLPFPASGPVVIELAPGARYELSQWGTTLYGPTGLPAIGAAIEGPFATTAESHVVIEGRGATIAGVGGLPFRLFAVAGTVRVTASEFVQARETHPLLTPEPGHLLSTGHLVLRDLALTGGVAKGGDGGNGDMGAGLKLMALGGRHNSFEFAKNLTNANHS